MFLKIAFIVGMSVFVSVIRARMEKRETENLVNAMFQGVINNVRYNLARDITPIDENGNEIGYIK